MGEYYVVGVLLVLELANLHVPLLSRSADILEGKGGNLVIIVDVSWMSNLSRWLH